MNMMDNSPNYGSYSKDPEIKRYRVESINVYEVTESELEIIERGSKNLIFLNFSIFLVSIAASFLIALVTCDFETIPVTQIIFIVITVCGFISGAFCVILWLKTKDDVEHIIDRIKSRSS